MNSTETYILQLYKDGCSPHEIAEKLPQWNHMKIRRLLKKMGVPMRDKSEGQKNGLKSGRCKHPKKKEDDDGKDS